MYFLSKSSRFTLTSPVTPEPAVSTLPSSTALPWSIIRLRICVSVEDLPIDFLILSPDPTLDTLVTVLMGLPVMLLARFTYISCIPSSSFLLVCSSTRDLLASDPEAIAARLLAPASFLALLDAVPLLAARGTKLPFRFFLAGFLGTAAAAAAFTELMRLPEIWQMSVSLTDSSCPTRWSSSISFASFSARALALLPYSAFSEATWSFSITISSSCRLVSHTIALDRSDSLCLDRSTSSWNFTRWPSTSPRRFSAAARMSSSSLFRSRSSWMCACVWSFWDRNSCRLFSRSSFSVTTRS
mmetsp:Transcript_9580/g.15924  ORF Transcript_9580/g.15924 Transcript_9580/m.15924 type:complete len:299 (-) Transcript_9580:443-1339(-)